MHAEKEKKTIRDGARESTRFSFFTSPPPSSFSCLTSYLTKDERKTNQTTSATQATHFLKPTVLAFDVHQGSFSAALSGLLFRQERGLIWRTAAGNRAQHTRGYKQAFNLARVHSIPQNRKRALGLRSHQYIPTRKAIRHFCIYSRPFRKRPPKMQRLEWSLTRIEPQGASSERRSWHIYFMEDDLLHAISKLRHV